MAACSGGGVPVDGSCSVAVSNAEFASEAQYDCCEIAEPGRTYGPEVEEYVCYLDECTIGAAFGALRLRD